MDMYKNINKSDIISLILERYGPLAASIIGGMIVFLFKDDICAKIADKIFQVNNLYFAVLSWSSIQVGFAFAVYGFMIGKSQGFVDAVRDTDAMQWMMIYVKRANIGGFLLAFLSLPLAVTCPAPTDADSLVFVFILLWFCLFLWTFFAFLRMAFNFGHLTGVRDRPPFHGA